MERSGHWLPVGDEGQQGGSGNAQAARLSREAASRRAAALRRSSLLILWSLEGKPEFRRSRCTYAERSSAAWWVVAAGRHHHRVVSLAFVYESYMSFWHAPSSVFFLMCIVCFFID